MVDESLAREADRDTARTAVVTVFVACFLVWQFALLAAMFIAFVWPRPKNWQITEILTNHFNAVVGLPAICVMSFAIVWSFRAISGPIELDALGFKLRGASGPVILWIATLLSLTLSLRLLW